MAVVEAAAGLALELGLKGICKACVLIYNGLSGSDSKKLEQTVNSLLPIIKDICSSSSESSSNVLLQKFQEFRDNLSEGNQLVDEFKWSRNVGRRLMINERAKKKEKSINDFIQNELQVVMATAQVSLSAQLEAVHEGMKSGMKTLGEAVDTGVQTVLEAVEQGVNSIMSKIDEQQIERSRQDVSLCDPPHTPSSFLGFDEHKMNVKKLLLEDGVSVVGVLAMGGAGKSTLATAVCNDDEIRGYFRDRVIYIEVSQSPDLVTILKNMWKKIVGGSAPDFTNVQNAHKELQLKIKSRSQPTLVVLDDVWLKPTLEKLLFEEKQCKTLVTTRDKDVIPKGATTRVYELPLLQQEHALSLFCYYAFGEPSIPIGYDRKLVEKVQQECNCLPLALKVIGSSLYGESVSVWERAEKRLSAGKPFNNDHKEILLNKLKTSIDVLDNTERECFLDLGAFPQRKSIPAKALLDIWVYVRKMKSSQADLLLWKFADRHLLELKKNPGNAEIIDDCMDAYSFSQHDVMRDLALFLANSDNNTQCRRLFMSQMKNHLPSEWEGLSSEARIVSIHTGAMEDRQWPKMEFPKVKALVLYLTASEYCIPRFLHTMKKLEVLIIYNTDGAKRTKLSGLASFQELPQLRSLHLERLIVPEEYKIVKSLEKIYLTLCKGLGRDKTFNFPRLLEFNVSYCIDLEELPAGLCSSASLKRLSLTHCHCLSKLPDEMGRLELLKEIRLYESPGLKALPSSICNLKKLKLLDISSCIRLKVNRWEHCELKETLQKVAKLPSLKRVICDEKNEKLFKMTSRNDLRVKAVVEPEPNLDWLDLEIGTDEIRALRCGR